jgi:hypothetical protein
LIGIEDAGVYLLAIGKTTISQPKNDIKTYL